MENSLAVFTVARGERIVFFARFSPSCYLSKPAFWCVYILENPQVNSSTTAKKQTIWHNTANHNLSF
jgi:hypothetical protein